MKSLDLISSKVLLSVDSNHKDLCFFLWLVNVLNTGSRIKLLKNTTIEIGLKVLSWDSLNTYTPKLQKRALEALKPLEGIEVKRKESGKEEKHIYRKTD